jgi:hypothetical protein
VPDENFVLDGHSFADEGVTGNLAPIAHTSPFLNFHECADLYVISDDTPVEIGKSKDPGPLPLYRGDPLEQVVR